MTYIPNSKKWSFKVCSAFALLMLSEDLGDVFFFTLL